MNGDRFDAHDIALIRLIVTATLLHGALPVIADLPPDPFNRAVDRLAVLADAIIVKSGVVP